jgi:catechol 2,3-dioxygenase-like lactoylglutathione lyase family enzyme
MITKIHSATVIVSDLDASIDFYVNTLGWEKRIDQPMGPEYRFVTVAPRGGDAELALGQAKAMGAEPGAVIIPGDEHMGPQTGISLAVEDMDETSRTLMERGVKFTGPPQEMPWGDKGCWMSDPDGNSFFLVGR